MSAAPCSGSPYASLRRKLSWPFYVVGTAVIWAADWINPDYEPGQKW